MNTNCIAYEINEAGGGSTTNTCLRFESWDWYLDKIHDSLNRGGVALIICEVGSSRFALERAIEILQAEINDKYPD